MLYGHSHANQILFNSDLITLPCNVNRSDNLVYTWIVPVGRNDIFAVSCLMMSQTAFGTLYQVLRTGRRRSPPSVIQFLQTLTVLNPTAGLQLHFYTAATRAFFPTHITT